MLETPEQGYAPETASPRRVAAAPRRMGRDSADEFADDLYDDEGASVERRMGPGVRLKFRGFPRTAKGRIVAGVGLLLCLGICFAALALTRTVILHDERFYIPSASAIEFQGNVNVTREQLLDVFGEDIERNIFSVPLAERRAEVERIPWVAHATVMRLLPDRLRVSVMERTPVAFVRQGGHIGLVDAEGVLLEMPQDGGSAPHYSFPVVSGIVPGDPLSTRAARMKIYTRFTGDLDGAGEKISQELSEVDLSNPEDVKALIPDKNSDILVHFGESDFLPRYKRFKEHLQEWKTQYPKLSSVDMRYERQVVLEMQPGAAAPLAGDGAVVADAGKDAAGKVSAAASTNSTKKPEAVAKKADVVAKKPGAVKKAAAAVPAHVTAVSEKAFDVPAKKDVAAKKPVVKAKARKSVEKHRVAVVRAKAKAAASHPAGAGVGVAHP